MSASNRAEHESAEHATKCPAHIDYRMSRVEQVVEEIGRTLRQIADTMQTTLARLTERDTTAHTAIADHEARLRSVEAEMPTIKLIRNWVIGGVVACVGMVGAGVVALVVHLPRA